MIWRWKGKECNLSLRQKNEAWVFVLSCLDKLVVNLVVKEELTASTLKVPDVQAAEYRNQKAYDVDEPYQLSEGSTDPINEPNLTEEGLCFISQYRTTKGPSAKAWCKQADAEGVI